MIPPKTTVSVGVYNFPPTYRVLRHSDILKQQQSANVAERTVTFTAGYDQMLSYSVRPFRTSLINRKDTQMQTPPDAVHVLTVFLE